MAGTGLGMWQLVEAVKAWRRKTRTNAGYQEMRLEHPLLPSLDLQQPKDQEIDEWLMKVRSNG